MPEHRRLIRYVDDAISQYATKHAVRVAPRGRRGLLGWIGISERGGHHQIHDHEDAVLAVVFYARTPVGASPLLFEDPRSSSGTNKATLFAGNLAEFKPKAGDLIVFPGWLRHGFPPNSDDMLSSRVTYSYNVAGTAHDFFPRTNAEEAAQFPRPPRN